jgi:hypothetical protein
LSPKSGKEGDKREVQMQQLDERSLRMIADFTVELLVSLERRSHPSTPPLPWTERLARAHGLNIDDPPYAADGRHKEQRSKTK